VKRRPRNLNLLRQREGEDASGDEAGNAERQKDPPHRLQPARPVDARRLLELFGTVLK
jgi:hypothetical protein